ncbi:tryptophan synthase subunit alpha [candidate division WOR-3 bacterium]|nr:tryptophan synthase subunit alpha [candidate division WOR-3 bacterium]
MNRMDRIFSQMMDEGDKILVTYFPIGDTIFNDNDIEWAGKYFESGSTLLEIGLPYEDPVMDGEVITNSMERARDNFNLDQVFDKIKEIRTHYPDNILQIMTYFENVKKYGIPKFAELCHKCDVDAVLSPNTPQDQISVMDEALEKYNIHNLRFAPYNLNQEVIKDLKENARGYIFLQAVDGATGPQENVSPQIGENVKILKEAGIINPVVAGFGISNPSQISEVVEMGADGAIVGSAIVKSIQEGNGPKFIRSLKESIH